MLKYRCQKEGVVMKKNLLGIAILSLLTSNGAFANYIYQTPTAGTMNFYPMMQHQLEKQETLDFVNDPENYKQKREVKDAQLDYEQGKTQSPYFKPTRMNINANHLKSSPVVQDTNMEFTKDENGQIRIQGIK